jgi:putative transposase
MTAWRRRQGDAVHHKRVARRLPTLGVETLYPTPRLRAPHLAQRVSPYLWRGGPITRVPHGWRPALTYLRLHGGCVSLGAVLEWFRRDGLSWAVSSTLAVGLCLEALAQALRGARPDMCHRAQGAPLTSLDLTGRLTAAGMQLRLAGRGRALDHVVVEWLWRTVKDEEGSWKDDETPREAMQGVRTFFGP